MLIHQTKCGKTVAAMVIASITLGCQSLESSNASAAAITPTTLSSGKRVLLTPRCIVREECKQAASAACSRGYLQLEWREQEITLDDGRVRTYSRLAFECIPSVTAEAVELHGEQGWRIAGCVSEAECDDVARTKCPHDFVPTDRTKEERLDVDGKTVEVQVHSLLAVCLRPREPVE